MAKFRKKYKYEGKTVTVKLRGLKLIIRCKIDCFTIYKLSVTYPDAKECQKRFKKYDKDNARCFVCHIINPYLIDA